MRGSLLLLAACSHAAAPSPTPKADPNGDPAKHTVQMVEVAPGVSLEVLDFGGKGDPVIFLAGLGNTAHVFDDFAPQLTDRHHVYAITRRGYGASSKPDGGYEVATRVADDLAVAAKLGVTKAIWIGHSVAGDELTVIGTHADRAAKLVYLDATNEHTMRLMALFEGVPRPEPPEPPADVQADPVKLNAYLAKAEDLPSPLGETLAQLEWVDGKPKPRAYPEAFPKIIGGSAPQDFAAVRVPALVLLAPMAGVEDAPGYAQMTPDDQQKWREAWPRFDKFIKDSYDDVRGHLAGAKVVPIEHSHHYLFVKSADRVLAEIRDFVDGKH